MSDIRVAFKGHSSCFRRDDTESLENKVNLIPLILYYLDYRAATVSFYLEKLNSHPDWSGSLALSSYLYKTFSKLPSNKLVQQSDILMQYLSNVLHY